MVRTPAAGLPPDTVEEWTPRGELSPDEARTDDTEAALPPPLPSRGHLRLVAKNRTSEVERIPWPFETKRAPSLPPSGSWQIPPRPIHLTIEDLSAPAHDSTPLVELTTPRVRGDASVIAELEAARRWRMGSLKSAVERIQSHSMGALRRFEALPRRHQISWVAAPYAGAVLLVALLLLVGRDEPVPISPEAPGPLEIALVDEPPPAPAEAPAPAPVDEVRAERHQLTVAAKLHVRPSRRAKVAAELDAGDQITVYPDFSDTAGWALAKTDRGTVGLIEQERLDGLPAEKVEKIGKTGKKAKKKKRRARPRG
jgi:hypothetical protein